MVVSLSGVVGQEEGFFSPVAPEWGCGALSVCSGAAQADGHSPGAPESPFRRSLSTPLAVNSPTTLNRETTWEHLGGKNVSPKTSKV